VAFEAGRRLATAELNMKMIADANCSYSDGEGFIDYLRSVKTVQLAIVFREEEVGFTHVSLRSKGEVDVAAFAQRRNGGGHRNAAAFRTTGDMATVRAAITREAMEYLA
jgi:phosphoesterase RecJ-like protein